MGEKTNWPKQMTDSTVRPEITGQNHKRLEGTKGHRANRLTWEAPGERNSMTVERGIAPWRLLESATTGQTKGEQRWSLLLWYSGMGMDRGKNAA
jgi:hypothetical protein